MRAATVPPTFWRPPTCGFYPTIVAKWRGNLFSWHALQSFHTIPKIGDHLLFFGWHGKSTVHSQRYYQSLGRMCKHHLLTHELITCHCLYHVSLRHLRKATYCMNSDMFWALGTNTFPLIWNKNTDWKRQVRCDNWCAMWIPADTCCSCQAILYANISLVGSRRDHKHFETLRTRRYD